MNRLPPLLTGRLLKMTFRAVDSLREREAMDVHMAVDALLAYDDDSVDAE